MLAAKKLFGIGRFSKSAQWLQRARAIAPCDAPLLAMLAEVYERGNQLIEAEHCAQSALALEPQHLKAVRIAAHLEQRRGMLEDARQRLRDHLSEHPGPNDWSLRYELASVLD